MIGTPQTGPHSKQGIFDKWYAAAEEFAKSGNVDELLDATSQACTNLISLHLVPERVDAGDGSPAGLRALNQIYRLNLEAINGAIATAKAALGVIRAIPVDQVHTFSTLDEQQSLKLDQILLSAPNNTDSFVSHLCATAGAIAEICHPDMPLAAPSHDYGDFDDDDDFDEENYTARVPVRKAMEAIDKGVEVRTAQLKAAGMHSLVVKL
jgi:hypothetical protein